ncbi:MAG: N-acetyltransferase family protein [Thermoanaerobaculia bacterium]
MTLRPARDSDAPALAVLTTQLGYPTGPEEAAARLRALQGSPGDAVLVAVPEEGEVIGWIHVTAVRGLELPPYALIVGLVVDEDHRGRGIGEELVEAAAEWARRNGCDTLRVRSNTVRVRAHAFYERLGFTRQKTQVSLVRRIGGE